MSHRESQQLLQHAWARLFWSLMKALTLALVLFSVSLGTAAVVQTMDLLDRAIETVEFP